MESLQHNLQKNCCTINLDIKRHRNKRLVIEPFLETNLTPLGYDLSIGYAVCLTPDPHSGSWADTDFLMSKSSGHEVPTVLVPPGTDVLCVTKERIHLSGKVLAQVHARSGIAAKGFFMNPVTVDPNFGEMHGRLVVRLVNVSDHEQILAIGETFATLVFHAVETETMQRPKSSDLEAIISKYTHLPAAQGQVRKYLLHYGAEDDEGEILFRDSIRELNKFRDKPWAIRKYIQAKQSFSINAALPYFALGVLDLILTGIRFVPAAMQSMGFVTGMSAEYLLVLITFNLAYIALVRTMGR
jgi:deoxycytidine triphosphate deaminase